MNNRKKILIALFSTFMLLIAVTLAGCFGDEDEGKEEEISTDKDGDGLGVILAMID